MSGIHLTQRSLQFSRREAMGLSLALAGGLWSSSRPARANEPGRKRALRVAHLTDIHVQPELRAGEGMSQCVQHVNKLVDRPDLILFGGDCIMDAFEQTRDRTILQWKLWDSVLAAENSIPTYACIGNHDIWGWDKSKSGATGDEVDYGKQWAVEALKLPSAYYSFESHGWKFIALDNVQQPGDQGKYSAYLPEAQFDWLKSQLEQTPAEMPVLVWSHIPIVSSLPLLDRRQTPTSDLRVKAGLMQTDAGLVVDLFSKYPNVKLCLSGHLHHRDLVRIRGVDFMCAGAVSGKWWRGPNAGSAEGYTLLDLYTDGSYEEQYVEYGWQAEV